MNRLAIPRLQISSGTRDPAEFRKRQDLITSLVNAQRGDILRPLAERRISMEQLWTANQQVKGNWNALEAAVRVLLGVPSLAANASQVAAATAGADATGITPTAPSPHATGPGDTSGSLAPSAAGLDAYLQLNALRDARGVPLWTVLDQEAWIRQAKAGVVSTDRYLTSLHALADCAKVIALSEEQRAVLENLDDGVWAALTQLRRRGVTIPRVRAWAKLSPQQLDAVGSEFRSTRLGDAPVTALRALPREVWDVLEQVGPNAPRRDTVEALSAPRPEKTRELLREASQFLGPDALLTDLLLLTPAHWKAVADVWGGGPADWNHMRRGLSAVLSLFLGSKKHTLRGVVIERIPLLAEKERVVDFTQEQFFSVLERVPLLMRPVFYILAALGLRIGEYLRLRPEHCLPNSLQIEVPGTKTTESAAPLSVHSTLWNMLMEAIPAPMQHSGIMKVWRVACESLEIYGVRLHDLRHCHGQWLIDAGVSEHEVMRSLRHKTVGMTRRYIKKSELKNPAAAMARVLAPAPAVAPAPEVPMAVAMGGFLALPAPLALIGSGESSTGEVSDAGKE